MLNRSDSMTVGVIDAEIAQFLRGPLAFGDVLFHEGDALDADQLHLEPGYADCLPILEGGCWRDPATIDLTEASR